MVILGIDPGIARTGFGIINTASPQVFVRCGIITTPKTDSPEDRLHTVGQDLQKIVEQSNPDLAVVETVLFGKNTTTAMLTSETRGVINFVLRQNKIPVHSLTPLQIKSRLTGYGQADKAQVQHVVTQRLNLNKAPQPDDAADAIAAALCIAEEAIRI